MPRYGVADVYYPETGGAVAALVVATTATFAAITEEHVLTQQEALPYRPGAFFERELPPLTAVLHETSGLDLLIIDGYVTLDPTGRPGLGHHVAAATGIPVIGVAKTRFGPATHAIEVYRGSSRRPLYVTADGLAPADAADLVRTMAGPHRLPDAVKRVDTVSRSCSSV